MCNSQSKKLAGHVLATQECQLIRSLRQYVGLSDYRVHAALEVLVYDCILVSDSFSEVENRLETIRVLSLHWVEAEVFHLMALVGHAVEGRE